MQTTIAWCQATLEGAPGSAATGSTVWGAADTATHSKEAVGTQTTIAWRRAALDGAPSRRQAAWGGMLYGAPRSRRPTTRRRLARGQATVAGRSVGTTTHRRTDARRGVERRHGGGTTGRGEAMDASVSASRWTTSRKDHRQDVSRH